VCTSYLCQIRWDPFFAGHPLQAPRRLAAEAPARAAMGRFLAAPPQARWQGALRRPAVPCRGTPRIFLRSCWAEECLWACYEGQMGRKLVRFGSRLRPTGSRQDASIEAHEAGRIWPSSLGVQWGESRRAGGGADFLVVAPNGPVQRPKPVRYVQCECCKKIVRVAGTTATATRG
jgi:hypothetical protein